MSSGNDFEHVFSEIKDNTLHLKVPTETRADANTVVLQCLQFRKYYLQYKILILLTLKGGGVASLTSNSTQSSTKQRLSKHFIQTQKNVLMAHTQTDSILQQLFPGKQCFSRTQQVSSDRRTSGPPVSTLCCAVSRREQRGWETFSDEVR